MLTTAICDRHTSHRNGFMQVNCPEFIKKDEWPPN